MTSPGPPDKNRDREQMWVAAPLLGFRLSDTVDRRLALTEALVMVICQGRNGTAWGEVCWGLPHSLLELNLEGGGQKSQGSTLVGGGAHPEWGVKSRKPTLFPATCSRPCAEISLPESCSSTFARHWQRVCSVTGNRSNNGNLIFR